MLKMLMDVIRGVGRFFSNERRRESDGVKPSHRGASKGCRAALSAVIKLLLVAVMLNPFAVRAETTVSVFSGLWTWESFTPSCNYTEHGTFNTAYANGMYSSTLYVSNQRDSNCQNNGPGSCTKTGYFAAAQDLLTTSQALTALNTFAMAGCGVWGDVAWYYQSMSFTSPDSISITGIAADGRSFSSQATRATPTTAIVASGQWNEVTYYPYCNYTELGTSNLTYANGAYSVTGYTSNRLGVDTSGNCRNTGPVSVACVRFYLSGQDMLSASQFQAMLVAYARSCRGEPRSPNIQSVKFTSPDSVSVTIIDPEPFGSFSFQMTRVASTPTSYALVVAKVGTGSGTVTSNPAGIDCGASCSAGFSSGAAVSLTATPASGSFFAGWRGACIGTGSCSVTMDATRKVIAIFKLKPFVAATSSNITATRATITARITFDTLNLGKRGAVFITSWAPVKGLGTLGILTAPLSKTMRVTTTGDNPYLAGKINSQQVALGTLLAAADPNAFVLVQLTSSGWQLVVNGELIPYASGVLGDSLAALSILNNTDPTNLLGAQFCLGYGTSAAEMVAAGRMLPVATIPDSNSTATSSGSCNVTDIVVEFYNTNLDHYFITADSSEAAAIDNGSAGPGWSRTGNSFRSGGSTSVCRFYGSQSPGPNSHFYTVDASECAGLQQLQASTPDTEKRWNFESLDFVSTPATNQTCPSGTTPVYRAYNNGFSRGVDSNHRITSSLTAIQEVVTRGWSNEGVVMCAPN